MTELVYFWTELQGTLCLPLPQERLDDYEDLYVGLREAGLWWGRPEHDWTAGVGGHAFLWQSWRSL